jgi:DNA-directed RNA polymerase specialized sigma24 family protein
VSQVSYARGQFGQDAPRTVEQFRPMILKYSWKFAKRAAGLGSPIHRDDIEQELTIVFMKCVESYDESRGGSFMNFTISAFYYEMNRVFKKDQRAFEDSGMRRTTSTALSVEDESESADLLDYVDSGSGTPEQFLEMQDTLRSTLARLSPPARTLVEAVLNPPPSVVKQFRLQEAGAPHRRTLGSKDRASKELSFHFVLSLFGVPLALGRTLKEEIQSTFSRSYGVACEI